MLEKKDFLTATCPICSKEYVYLPIFKPVTCTKIECVEEADRRGLITKIGASEDDKRLHA